ncbi:hypothetical protein EV383_2694 [Pseudonocardia sediminis]|uniref:Uncharacterized protein n=1 Tax=Pseudonocardia sediminis TaxID=1397368 RepID=A0A4Q7UZT5_PSEST|nr:hypothetical protein EV383_2694 [Pseudonocardia sediminis]
MTGAAGTAVTVGRTNGGPAVTNGGYGVTRGNVNAVTADHSETAP